MCDNYRGCICRSQLNVEGVEGAGHHLVPEVLHLHTAMGSYSTRVYKSWARNNVTMFSGHQNGISYSLFVVTIKYFRQTPRHVLTFFVFFGSLKLYITLMRCR